MTTSRRATSSPPAPAPTTSRREGILGLALFDRLFRGPSWRPWRVVTLAWFGLGDVMTDEDLTLYTTLTGRSTRPSEPARQGNFVVSRRGGKSIYFSRFLIPYYSAVREYSFAPGEKGSAIIVCPDRDQAGVDLSYAAEGIAEIPNIEIVRRTQDLLALSNGIEILVATADFRTGGRARTAVVYFVDEGGFLPTDDSATPDFELKRSALPTLITTGGPFILASSPYGPKGLLYQTDQKYWGDEASDVLCVRAPSIVMNPTLSRAYIDRERQNDPAGAVSEWDGQFRSDQTDLLPLSVLQGLVPANVSERPPAPGVRYTGFIDPAGGSGTDSFGLAVAHRDNTGMAILDTVQEARPPFNPEHVTATFAAVLKRYAIRTIHSDSYAGEWPRQVFARHGITVETSGLNKSELFLELVPMATSGTCSLLDIPKLINQLATLQRSTGTGGRDKVDHRKGAHDDMANVAAGALILATRSVGLLVLPLTFTRCNNFEAAGQRCVFLGTGSSFPSDAHCKRYCPGHQTAVPAFRQHQQTAREAGEQPLSARQFLDTYFDVESSPLTANVAWQQLASALEHLG